MSVIKDEIEARERSARVPLERVVIPEELIDLIRAFSDMWVKTEKCRAEALAMPPEEMRNHLRSKWPALQGMARINTRKIGAQPFDRKKAARAIEWMIEEKV